jgi:hypothetical protein
MTQYITLSDIFFANSLTLKNIAQINTFTREKTTALF